MPIRRNHKKLGMQQEESKHMVDIYVYKSWLYYGSRMFTFRIMKCMPRDSRLCTKSNVFNLKENIILDFFKKHLINNGIRVYIV